MFFVVAEYWEIQPVIGLLIFFGKELLSKNIPIIKKEYIEKTNKFYEKHGGKKTILHICANNENHYSFRGRWLDEFQDL
jgi:hypothetical protein